MKVSGGLIPKLPLKYIFFILTITVTEKRNEELHLKDFDLKEEIVDIKEDILPENNSNARKKRKILG